MNKARLQKAVGVQIRQIRKDKNMSIQELATLSGKTRQVIQRIETSLVNPEVYTLNEIASGLGIKLEELLKGIK